MYVVQQRRNPLMTLLKIVALLIVIFCLCGGCALIFFGSSPTPEGPTDVPSTSTPSDRHS